MPKTQNRKTTAASSPEAPGLLSYLAFGLSIRSELPLPELGQVHGDRAAGEGGADVLVRFGDTPVELAQARFTGNTVQVSQGQLLLNVPGIARYHVREGVEIVITAAPGVTERNLRAFLLGTAFGALCLQRGLLPLHAGAIEIGDAAVAVVGKSGAGKSTLAAFLHERGHRLLCDDVCVVSMGKDGAPLAWPGVRRMKLWRQSIDALGKDTEGLDRVVDDMDKFHVPAESVAEHRPFPLRAIYVLDDGGRSSEGGIVPLEGVSAARAIMAHTYRQGFIAPLGLTASHFAQCVAIAKQAQIWSMGRRWGFDNFAAEAERLERHMLDAVPG